MLDSLEVGNFKAFRDPQRIPLKPITLIFGANSSGKSSLLHALLLLRHGIESGDWNPGQTRLGGQMTDLGGFETFVHRHEVGEPVTLGVTIDEGSAPVKAADAPETLNRKFTGIGVRLEIRANPYAEEVSCPVPTVVEISSHGEVFLRAVATGKGRPSSSTNGYGSYAVPFVNINVPLVDVLVDHVAPGRVCFIAGRGLTIREALSELGRPDSDVWKALALSSTDELGGSAQVDFNPQLRVPPDSVSALATFLHYAKGYEVSPSESSTEDLPDLYWSTVEQASGLIHPILLSALQQVDYLGPLRAYPQRHLHALAQARSFQESTGLHAWEAVLRDEHVRERVNHWLGSDFLRTGYRFRERAQYAVEDIIRAFDLMAGEPEASFPQMLAGIPPSTRDLVLTDLRNGATVTHRDIGLGISQVLPILVAAFGSTKRQIMIEQPELHLHPALQAELGDVLIHATGNGRLNRFVIETHSEHLILRILRRIRETSAGELQDNTLAIRPEDVSVLYVEPSAHGSIVRDIPVNEDGDFTDRWPDGFFTERATELFS